MSSTDLPSTGTPKVLVRYWAGARRAAGQASDTLSARTLGELIAQLRARTDVGAVAESCTFLVDGGAGDPDQPLTDSSVVDVLPPFAGG